MTTRNQANSAFAPSLSLFTINLGERKSTESSTARQERILTPHAPAPIGPYSQAIRSGDLLFCSGQIPLDPTTGKLIEGDITAQTHQVVNNIRAVLQAAGLDTNAIVKTTIFLTDMADFPAVNSVYGSMFPTEGAPPARSTVAVAALPLGSRVEIEVTASYVGVL